MNDWLKSDLKTKVIIGLSSIDKHIEHVRDVESAYDMWAEIKNICQRRKLLIRLNARLNFHLLQMAHTERVIPYICRAE